MKKGDRGDQVCRCLPRREVLRAGAIGAVCMLAPVSREARVAAQGPRIRTRPLRPEDLKPNAGLAG